MYKNNRVVAVIPALNEENAIGKVVTKLLSLTDNSGMKVMDEVIVCDNASTDETATTARQAGASVVYQNSPGYGIACQTAINKITECDIVLFVDGDDSCFVEQAIGLLQGIVDGDDLTIGSRTLGHIERGALTPVQRFGNWLSAKLIHFFWQQNVTDLGPFRAIKYESLKRMSMQDKTFGWTVEMQVKAAILGMKTGEYPVDSKVRIGQSKISGTVRGSILAGVGILSMIARLRLSALHSQGKQDRKEKDAVNTKT